MNFRKFFLLIGFLSLVFTGVSQNVLFQKTDVDQRYKIDKIGVNRRVYRWASITLLGTDLAVNNTESKQDFSNYYAFNWNFKYKINGLLSHGLNYGLHRQVYRLSQEGLNALSREYFDKGKLIYWGVNAQYFWRFNFDPWRGDIFGKYLDLSLFGQWNFYQRARFVDGNMTEKIVNGDFSERYVAGVEARFGREALSLYVRYKLYSGVFKEDSAPYTDLDLARLSVGLAVGFVR